MIVDIERHDNELHFSCPQCGEYLGVSYEYLEERTCYSDNEPERLYNDKWHVFRCSECGNKVDLCRNPKPNYCPNCGAKVVE